MNTAFSYGTITDEDVRKTKAFVKDCLDKLKSMSNDDERREYILKTFYPESLEAKNSKQSSKKDSKKH